MERMIEVCAGSYQDCIAAYQGSAKRVELNSALSVGGLTPSVASLIRVKKETDLTVICMVRVRAAGFCYEKEDVEIIGRDMDSTGLVSSYTGHDFYIGGADAAYLDHICWKYILPSSDGKENVV